MNIDYKLIGQRIKQIRKERNLTQETLAERLDVSIGYISQIERGVTKISLDLLGAVSSILQCDVAELITGSATKTTEYLERELYDEINRVELSKRKFLLKIIRSLNEDL